MTVEKLQEIVENSLVSAFARTYNDRKRISVYPNSEDIYFEEDGVAVYCIVDLKPFGWFDGSVSFIVGAYDEVFVNMFIGDECIDPERAAELDLEDEFWEIENEDDFLMIGTWLELCDDEALEREITRRLEHLKSEAFAETVTPIAKCFK